MNRRQIQIECESDDGTRVYASLDDWAADGGVPESHVILRTTGGRPVHVRMRDGRELAAWLIEHCIDVPDEESEPTVADQVRERAANAVVATAGPMVGGGGGVAYGGAGGMSAYGGQGGAGGSATIVQRTV